MVKRFLIGFAVVLLLSINGWGCSAAGSEGPSIRPQLVLSPEPQLEAATRAAVKAWSASTGIDIAIGPGGAPVRSEPDLEGDCAQTETMRRVSGEYVGLSEIRVLSGDRTRCGSEERSIRHELGHALQQWGSFDAWIQHDGHTEDRLMAAQANEHWAVDESALDLVCRVAPCSIFVPESE